MASTNENNYQRKSPKEKEQERMNYVNNATLEMTRDAESFNRFLEVQSHFERYSLNNNLLIASQRPDATRLKTMDQWNADGFRAKKGCKTVWIYEPEQRTYEGKTYTNYKAKGMIDSKDLTKPVETEQIRYPVDKVINALVSESGVQVVTLQNYPANENAGMYFDKEKNCIFARAGMSAEESFTFLVMALSHSESAKNDENYVPEDHEFEAKCTANVMCRKYGVPTTFTEIKTLPEEYKSMEPKEIRASLSNVNLNVKKLCKDIYHSLVKGKEGKEPEKETPVKGDSDERA